MAARTGSPRFSPRHRARRLVAPARRRHAHRLVSRAGPRLRRGRADGGASELRRLAGMVARRAMAERRRPCGLASAGGNAIAVTAGDKMHKLAALDEARRDAANHGGELDKDLRPMTPRADGGEQTAPQRPLALRERVEAAV